MARAPGVPALEARLPGATRALWIADPVVGDRLAVATSAGAPAGVAEPRAFVEGALLASVQGLAVQPAVDDLTVAVTGDTVRIGRPRGLALSSFGGGAAPRAGRTKPDPPGRGEPARPGRSGLGGDRTARLRPPL